MSLFRAVGPQSGLSARLCNWLRPKAVTFSFRCSVDRSVRSILCSRALKAERNNQFYCESKNKSRSTGPAPSYSTSSWEFRRKKPSIVDGDPSLSSEATVRCFSSCQFVDSTLLPPLSHSFASQSTHSL